MNINENMRNYSSKDIERIGGMPTRFLIFQLPFALEYQTWYPKYAQIHSFNLMIKYLKYLIIIFMNINENIIRDEKKRRRIYGVYLHNFSYLSCHSS